MRYLLIGGDFDGTWMEVPEGHTCVRMTTTRNTQQDYFVQAWCGGANGKANADTSRVFAYHLKPHEVFQKLMIGYHPILSCSRCAGTADAPNMIPLEGAIRVCPDAFHNKSPSP